VNITRVRSNGAYWADGGIVSTAEESVLFLQALKEGRIVHKDTLELMHDWHSLRNLPLQYGYGTMYLEFSFIGLGPNAPPIWGHSGSPGSFLYYSEELDLYMAGTINQTQSRVAPFILMMDVMEAVD
jgi:D-alanyl-D-alanine carboxypeptidase